jgi:pilus assembly protein CpaE
MTQQPAQKINVLIVDDIPETRENLRKLLYFESDIVIVGTAENGQKAVEQAKKLQPDIVLMDINMPDMDGITATETISRVASRSQIIMMSVQSETDYLRRSMMAGAKYFLTKPFTSEELSSSIRRVFEQGVGVVPPAAAMETGVPGAPPGPGQPPPREGKLIVIYSPKGGTGCSVVASNLAIALAQTTSKNVALVDGSLQFGDIGVLLNLQSGQTIADATKRIQELDSDLLTVIMSSHPSGIKVLAAPPNAPESDTITAEAYKKIVSRLKKVFDYVLLDTWSHLDDIVLSAIDLADRILIVMTPEIPSIKSTKQFFELAEALDFPSEQIDLILNKTFPRDRIRAEQIENTMKHRILAQFEFDPRGVRPTINQGQPLILAQPNHPLSQRFLQLAEQEAAVLEPQPEEAAEQAVPSKAEQPTRTGLFGRRRK